MVMERGLQYQLDVYDFDSAVKKAIDEYVENVILKEKSKGNHGFHQQANVVCGYCNAAEKQE